MAGDRVQTMETLTGTLATALALLVPLFIATDPLGAVPLVLSWTGDLPRTERHRQLRDALFTALGICALFLLVGRQLLVFLGVTLPDFLVAGGLVLLILAINDLVAGGGHEALGSSPRRDFGVVPIGTPLLAGPATLATLLVLSTQYGIWLTALAIAANLFAAWRIFEGATLITQKLGSNGVRAASKVISLFLAAIAIRFIREGIVAAFGIGG
jgi:multiple antibiotic resistance protein